MSDSSAEEGPLIRSELPAPGVARVVLARPSKRNAQNRRMLYELNDAFDEAARNSDVKVIILAADGPDFSSGHDMSERGARQDLPTVSTWGGFDLPGAEGHLAYEEEMFLGLCWRWRNIPKPTIAEVQGHVIAGGLMLVWPCDLIIASEDATFSDPVVAFGVNGHEYFVHVWELGARKAKELLFTGDSITADECRALGMVNHVVPGDELEGFTLAMASRIALRPSMGLKLAKQAANQSIDAQGIWAAVQAGFSLHQLGHSHNRQVFGRLVDPGGAALIRESARRQARNDEHHRPS